VVSESIDQGAKSFMDRLISEIFLSFDIRFSKPAEEGVRKYLRIFH
jgi:hypothetical protein